MPLAICNPNSIQQGDPIVVEIVEVNRTGENYYLRYNKEHEWHWASNMVPSEVLVFATWDSKETERTTNCAVIDLLLIDTTDASRCLPHGIPKPESTNDAKN